MSNGVGLMIDAAHPRLLRVELAEARARGCRKGQHRVYATDSRTQDAESSQPRR